MDNLVLIRVASTLDAALRCAALRELRQEGPANVRLLFDSASGPRSVAISLRPEQPWIGRPATRSRPPRGGPVAPVFVLARKVLQGAVVASVEKPGPDRLVRIRFADGHSLIAELGTHRANLVFLDGRDRVLASARHPRTAVGRLTTDAPYRPPALPAGVFVPFGRAPEAIDRYLADRAAEGATELDILRRAMFGVGTHAARLVLAEASVSGSSPGAVLADRLRALAAGELDPVIEGPEELLGAVRGGDFDPRETRLLPWAPPGTSDADRTGWFRRGDPAATAGLFHEAHEAWALLRERALAVRSVLTRERERAAGAERKARRDLATFRDPDRYRLWGEALLAGLATARREGEFVLVPDPYDPGSELAVPVPAGVDPRRAADECFRAHRRGRRGLELAERRAGEVAARRARLDALEARLADARSETELDHAERLLREEGIPIGLERPSSAGRVPRGARPRLEAVRVFRTSDGLTVLAGRNARGNQRLTFRLAAPEDFWLHAAERHGAHVVLRNEERAPRPPASSLREAAAIAAWYSDGRTEALVDVRWTRRKYVRRARGAAVGTVTLKRFETLRVRPAEPEAERGVAAFGGPAVDPSDGGTPGG